MGVDPESLPKKDTTNSLATLEDRDSLDSENIDVEAAGKGESLKGANKDDTELTVENFRRPVSVMGTSAR